MVISIKNVMVISILQMIYTGMSLKLLDHTSRHCCRNLNEKLQQGFIIIAYRHRKEKLP